MHRDEQIFELIDDESLKEYDLMHIKGYVYRRLGDLENALKYFELEDAPKYGVASNSECEIKTIIISESSKIYNKLRNTLNKSNISVSPLPPDVLIAICF